MPGCPATIEVFGQQYRCRLSPGHEQVKGFGRRRNHVVNIWRRLKDPVTKLTIIVTVIRWTEA